MPLPGHTVSPRPAIVAWSLLVLGAWIVLALILLGRSVQAASSLPGTCRAPLILNLQPGEHHADGSVSGPVASNIPLDPVTIALPLYPGAQTSTEPVPALAVAGYGNPYQKSAAAEYLLPGDLPKVVVWYTRAMASCGYLPAGLSQTSGNGMTAETHDFASSTLPSARIALSFQDVPNSAGGTLFLASAAALSLPPRPRQSELEDQYRAVGITYTTSGFNPPGKHLHIHLSVRKQTAIQDLVRAVDVPQEVDTADHSCGGRDWNVILVFHSQGGKAIKATLQCGDLRIGSDSLVDPYNEALLTVQNVVLASCQKKACKLVG